MYEVGWRDQGKQRWEVVRDPVTKEPGDLEAARALLAEKQGRIRRGIRVSSTRMSLEEVVGLWREDRAYLRLRPRTRVMYDSSLDLHVLPRLGRTRVTQLTDADIAGLIAGMERKGLSGGDDQERVDAIVAGVGVRCAPASGVGLRSTRC